MKEKVAFDPDKHRWRPSPLIGQIVLVTTLNYLRMFAFLEAGTYGVVERARQVGKNDSRG